MKTILFIMLVLFSPWVSAEEVTELYLHASTCHLQERGIWVKSDPISVEGHRSDFGCLASIKDEVFNKRYKFCVYSGFEIRAAPNASWYACGISREKDSFMFAARLDKDKPSSADIECKFMCYLK